MLLAPRILLTTVLVLPLLGATLAGCVVETPRRAVVVVPTAPPPPRVEVVPAAPPGRAEVVVWDRGHWQWDGRAYVWVPGHYVERPRREAVWEPGHWAQEPSGYAWVEGHWR